MSGVEPAEVNVVAYASGIFSARKTWTLSNGVKKELPASETGA